MNLRIISQRPEDMGSSLKRYLVDGVPTVGVFPKEPFWIGFQNTSDKRAQITLAVDGTNVSTGEKATLAGNGNWLVEPRRTMTLKAWPESHHGGAAFVFTQVGNSVALHTHAVLDAVGYISAAVWLEGYEPPVFPRFEGLETTRMTKDIPMSFDLEATLGPAVGAGEYVDQQIVNVEGLTQPVYHGIVSVRYLWWQDLQNKLRQLYPMPKNQHPTGFEPGRMANLGNTPRIKTQQQPAPAGFSRFE